VTDSNIPIEDLCRCDNCGNESSINDHDICEIHDLFERVEPGGTMPAGECHKCSALTYLVQNPNRHDLAALLRSAAAFLGRQDFSDRDRRKMIKNLLNEANKHYQEV
jgi:hypothetical protein